MLMYRAYGVVKGDVTVIRWIAGDIRAADTAVGLVFASGASLGTVRYRHKPSPLQWLVDRCAVMSTLGLALFCFDRLAHRSGSRGIRLLPRIGADRRVRDCSCGPGRILRCWDVILGWSRIAFFATAAVTMRAVHNVTWTTWRCSLRSFPFDDRDGRRSGR